MSVDQENRFWARFHFDKAKNKAFFRKLINGIFHKQIELFRFEEVKHMLSPHGMVYRGVKPIPIDSIVGSEGRYQDFDNRFLPKQTHTRFRWENIDLARMDHVELPPISVYKIGDYYFVKDGNHRVSVAREQGQTFIDAEIVELLTKVTLKESELSEKGILLAHSRKYFLDKSRLDEFVPGVSVELTHPWGYYRLIEDINTFAYLLAERESRYINWDEAVTRWYQELYVPVIELIRYKGMLRDFPDREEGDLFIWVMDHWHFLKQKYGNVAIWDAMDDYSQRYAKKPVRKFFYKIKLAIERLFTGR